MQSGDQSHTLAAISVIDLLFSLIHSSRGKKMPDISVFSSVRPCWRFVLHACNLIFFSKKQR